MKELETQRLPAEPVATRAAVDTVVHELQQMLAEVRPFIRPALTADLQERIWTDAERLRALLTRLRPAPPPLAHRPRSLPSPLNPFFFSPKE